MLVYGVVLSLPVTVVDMHAPVSRSHPGPARAVVRCGALSAVGTLAPKTSAASALGRFALGVALASCTLTRDDFAPVITEAGPVQPGVEPSAPPEMEPEQPATGGCTASIECPDGFECVGDVCLPVACDAAEDVGACVVDVCTGDGCTPSCSNGVQDEAETGLDCGGPCAPCPSDPGCESDSECAPGTCVEGACAEPSCDDGTANQDETGPDCGGATCARCAVGAACGVDADCDTGLFCAPSTSSCAPVSCQDEVRNGAERAVDCGGGSCPGCEAGAPCEVPADCASSSCVDDRCAEPSCDDAVRNGDESDVDCGGGCAPCGTGLACAEAADCASQVCDDDDCAPGVAECCQAASCNDGVRNGNETATDCGAAPCGRCDVGTPCTQAGQCASNVCAGNVCAEFCDDGVRSGNESAADCGGSEAGCPRCGDGQPCGVDADCASRVCDGGLCVSCSDGLANGDEGGVDCGGSQAGCPACPRCNADNSIDLGGVGQISTIAGDACARITAFPGYPPTLIDSYEAGTFPVPFSFRQECSAVAGTGQFDAAFDRVTLSGLSIACPVILDFAGSAPFEVRWF